MSFGWYNCLYLVCCLNVISSATEIPEYKCYVTLILESKTLKQIKKHST